jgi:hypothetical protein
MSLTNTHISGEKNVFQGRQRHCSEGDRGNRLSTSENDDAFYPSPDGENEDRQKTPTASPREGLMSGVRELVESHQQGSSSGETTPVSGSPAGTRKSAKLQGLILRVDQTMDPLSTAFYKRNIHQVSGGQGQVSGGQGHGSAGQGHGSAGRPASYPYSHNADSHAPEPPSRTQYYITAQPDTHNQGETTCEVQYAGSGMLQLPVQDLEDTSDTESIVSVGPMLDDEQVEMLTMDFSTNAAPDETESESKFQRQN